MVIFFDIVMTAGNSAETKKDISEGTASLSGTKNSFQSSVHFSKFN